MEDHAPESRHRWIRNGALFGTFVAAALVGTVSAADFAGLTGSPGIGTRQIGMTALLLGLTIALGWGYLKLGGSGRRLGRLAIAPAALLSGIVLAISFAAANERGADFPYDRTTGPTEIRSRVLHVAGLSGTGVCRCAPDREWRIAMTGGFETMAALYRARGSRAGADGPSPGVLLVHGNVWNGRKSSAGRIWASKLAAAGFTVLSFDRPGFGDSDNPYGRGPDGLEAARDVTGQARAALDALIAVPGVDPSDITVMGHSGGVWPAVDLGLEDERVRRVVAWVSPPPDSEVPADSGTARDLYFLVRQGVQHTFIYGHETPEWVFEEVAPADVDAGPILEPSERQTFESHPPYLLVLGERDAPDGHAFELERFSRTLEPKSVLHVPRADHYLNSAQSLGFVFYDRAVAHGFVADLVAWIRASAPSERRGASDGSSR